jgi:hypothetical protein
VIHGKLQERANRIIGVKRQTMAIGGQHKEEVQQDLFLAERGQKAIREETVRYIAESALEGSDSVRIDDFLDDHGRSSIL